MGLGIRVRFLLVIFSFFWVLAANNSQGIRHFSFILSEQDIPDIDQDKVEEVWIQCTRELIESSSCNTNLMVYLSEVARKNENLVFDESQRVKEFIQKTINDLPKHERYLLLECLRLESLWYDESTTSITWISKCQDLFFSRLSIISRRFLNQRRSSRRYLHPPSRTQIIHETVKSLLLSQLSVVDSSEPLNGDQPSSMAVSTKSPISNPTTAAITAPVRAPLKGTSNNNKNEHYILAVLVVGGMSLLIGLGVLLICITIKRRNARARDRARNRNPIESHIEEGKDEKPLLNFSSSDVSSASSQQSCITGKPSRDKICKNPSAVGCNLSAESDTRNSSKVETQSSDNVSGDNDSLLPFPPGKSAPPPATVTPPPSPPPNNPLAPGAPPPPKMARPPPNPPKHSRLGPHHRRGNCSLDESPKAPKAKLKPFFWDKVQANPDHSMVWHNIKGGSFQFNEEMMQMLFGYAAPLDKGNNDNKKNSQNSQSQPVQIRIIDSKKAQNLAILLKALNVTTEEVCDALMEGNELPLELIQTLLKMAPTTDEELKLRLFSGDISQLGPAERFLKVIVDIPFAFKRFESLLFMCSLHEEVSSVSESFTTLEIACKELRNSRLFLKLLEAVLKTGNRMNDGTFRGGAQAFKLETLLKLSDVKGTDGKTTLLHFVVQEIIRSEGVRAARRLIENEETTLSKDHESEEYHSKLGLEVVSELTHELENVKKAAVLDGDIITGTVLKLGNSFTKTKDFLKKELMNVEDAGEFNNKLGEFLDKAQVDIIKLKEEDKRIMELVKKTGDYFHGNAGKDEGLRLFTIVRDFLIILDKVCREVRSSIKWCPSKIILKKESVSDSARESISNSAQESVSDSAHESHNDSLNDTPTKLFPAIKERRSGSD